MYKIHCLNNISAEGLALLTDEYELTDNVEEADAILVRSADMHVMDIPANLKAVARAGAGVNNIPLDTFAEAGIAVFNTPGANANAVKELVLAGMLLASRDIIGGVEWVRANADDENVGKSAEKAKKQFAGGEIMGKTLGVIGLGAIGAKVAQAAEALGMKVIGYDPAMDGITVHERISPAVEFTDDLAKLYPVCDFITIHVPALPATKMMINGEALAQMKDGVVFLNFSRDVLVDDEAMAAALKSGKVAAYVTDFANPAVVKMERAIVIPHLGASTAEAEDNCAKMAVEEVMAYLERGEKIHCVNM
ncbi:3-phosphoglycerate dehydrogenase [Adlercreutzia muris]|uniref:3-phosphoglycerate dehydrogenase n=1 Tax=Adlercreutzia muris TaxID=1796610 RepID=A0A7C8BTZ4_9ACTN|nr:3-phosphoglycerate dehydrogenase [Adlercreutzia muris]KAB1642348.1 3-phosphoglycerate dehydrogenase [Adlercreutzia muris]MCR2028322.1 3-phosphoglycerate dehydrogenase [Adlercreutzia muris]MCU7583953.1 3-phosphoglycerate dehydrogenase [Adlercreutzia muris]